MNDAVKLMKRSYIISELASMHENDGPKTKSFSFSWHILRHTSGNPKFVTLGMEDLYFALEKITNNSDRDWLAEKIYQINRSGICHFLDYLDDENLERMTDPSINLFPLAGV
ncbi:MAG: hypothetical protein CMI60_19565 [Parvibaculum sp.]|nr:hypothetical protein [Parvibaculum sp.]